MKPGARRTPARASERSATPVTATPATRPDAAWLIGLPLACWAAMAVAAGLGRFFDYDLWDNFEYFTAILNYAHGLWLKGVVPIWNPYQHLGEPILAAGQPGVLYFPYTLSVLITHLLGLAPGRLMLVIVLLHTPVAAVGWFVLLRRLGVRPVIAAVAALSACLGGFVTGVSTVWIFMQAAFTWLPWVIYGIVRQLTAPGWGGAAALVIGLVATAFLGHPQMLIYQWLTAGLFLLAFGLLVHRRAAAWPGLLGLLAWAGVLSLPALLPMTELFSLSIRTRSFKIAEFMRRGLSPWALIGWLLPIFRAPTGVFLERASVMGYQGAWVVPAIVAGLLRVDRAGRDTTGRAFVACALVVMVLLVIAGGGHNPLYRATYGLPLWSSLRWPFKIFLMSQGVLVLVAALGLELWVRDLAGLRWLRGAPVALFVLAAVVAAARVGVVADPSGAFVLGLIGAAATLAALPWLERRWACVLFAAGAFASVASVTAAAHDLSMKRYTEGHGRVGAAALGLTRDVRVLPLTTQDEAAPEVEPLALFHSATANGYLGATGTTAGLVPTWYSQTLPCDVFGAPDADAARILLGSHLLRTFNVGYLIVGARDTATRALVETMGGATLRHATGEALTYEVQGTLPRAYFASRAYRFAQADFWRGMVLDQAPVDAAFIDGWDGAEVVPIGRVTGSRWRESRIDIAVDAPDGGLLVVGESDFPGWSCRVDGRPAPIERVNQRVIGVALPRGARQVRLDIHSDGLDRGLWAAALGSLLAAAILVVARRRSAAATSAAA